ncbi:MAG TPA: deoxyribodipyrimidine photolyase [Planctomycetota bacterium]|nr:deoxyribodipyrimidine photolyase [Planctomycetota bacterium]
MIAARRARSSFALDRAIEWARELDRPLVVLEALRAGYAHASDRLHRFVLDGMRDNARAFAPTPILHHPYVERRSDAGKGLLSALARQACVVVTDEFPCFFLPKMVAAAARAIDAHLEVVDGNGLLPLAATSRSFTAAVHFRRWAQKELPAHLAHFPVAEPLSRLRLPELGRLPADVARRWPRASDRLLDGDAAALRELPIDHEVPPVRMRGGSRAAHAALRSFVRDRLDEYDARRGEPEANGTSRLSPYLHFGHLGVHEVVRAVLAHERWSPSKLAPRATGSRDGWWGVSAPAEAFLDELVTWRELGYHHCARRPRDYDRYEALPAWARATLEVHARDPRPHVYSRADIEAGATHDPVFNAAQGQMRREGWFHNSLRMLWGKKILEWSRTPRAALATMEVVMNRWSLDGRNPNSYTGYLWSLGGFDRPWPERAIYGRVRAMMSASLARKVSLARYVAAYARG